MFDAWQSQSHAPYSFTLRFWNEQGGAWAVPLGTLPAGFSYNGGRISGTIPFNGSVTIETLDTGSVAVGWAELSYDWSNAAIGGLAVFRYKAGKMISAGKADWEAVVPISANNDSHFGLLFDQTVLPDLPQGVAGQQLAAGIAIVNPDVEARSDVTVTAWDEGGNKLFEIDDVINLDPKAHMQFMLADRYKTLAGKRGVLEFHVNNGKCAALGLRANPTGSLTSIHTIEYY